MSLKLNSVTGQRPKVLIPDNTVVKALLRIKKGKHNDSSKGWEGGYATFNEESGSSYLHCIAFVLEGEYARQTIHFFISLDDPNNPESGERGLNLMRTIVDSAHGFSLEDDSSEASDVRNSYDFAKLDGLEFTGVVNTVINMKTGKDKNVLYYALTEDDDRYLGKTIPDNTSKPKK